MTGVDPDPGLLVHDRVAQRCRESGATEFELADDGRHVVVAHLCTARWAEDGVTCAILPTHAEGWRVTSTDPLTVTPSILCPPQHGGCGWHGFIRGGVWCPA